MIFVSVGTHEAPFDRLLRTVYELGLDEEIVVQHGPSSVRSELAELALQAEYLSFDEVVEYIRAARAVVTHAGVGSVMVALANGKRPIVMPRLHSFDEHVDDHQLELARRLEANGLVTVVESPAALSEALAQATESAGGMTGMPWLGSDLGEYLATHLESSPLAVSQS
jgi:UDP-N-acetylglucosamine transferase subunit ALG13